MDNETSKPEKRAHGPEKPVSVAVIGATRKF